MSETGRGETGRERARKFGPYSTNPEKQLPVRKWVSDSRDRRQRRIRLAERANAIDPDALGKHVLNLEKHTGKTIADIYRADPDYLRSVADQSSASELTRRVVAKFLAGQPGNRRTHPGR